MELKLDHNGGGGGSQMREEERGNNWSVSARGGYKEMSSVLAGQ